MERIYLGTTLILLVSCVFILYGTKKDGETIDGLMKELYRLEKLNCDLKSQNNECSSINYGLNFERLDLQRKNRDMSIREGLNKREIAKLKREIERLKILSKPQHKYSINDFQQGPIKKNGWESIICLNEKHSIAKVMINREYELLENAESISRLTKGDTIKVTAQFDKELEHKHVYDTEAKALYEIVEVEEHSMRGFETSYTYELKKVS